MKRADLIPRTCTEVVTAEGNSAAFAKSEPLRAFRHVPAYVLLGEPGSGKTTEFEQDCAALGDAAAYIKAREFRHVSGSRLQRLRGRTLYIDGLDETRAGGSHGSEAVDEIQAKLFELDQPAFRISCRGADWFGAVDRSPLNRASPDGHITTLQLDPLSSSDARRWLAAHSSATDAAAFLLEASSRGFDSMLDSPQMLKFLFESVAGGHWPDTRSQAFRRACERLVSEPRNDHPHAAEVVPTQEIMNAAGRVFAAQLLSGSAGITFGSDAPSRDFIAASVMAADVATSIGVSANALRPVIATSLFKSAGDQCYEPVHRQVAEYLGAGHLADLIGRGVVSVGRVCGAMMSPVDNRVVTDMRGLAAWLGTHSAPARNLLIEADPVGVALYGDISEWPLEDRRRLLDCLVSQARPEDLWRVTWFDAAERRYRDARAWSFRSLCKPDMTLVIGELLDTDRRKDVLDHVRELLLQALSEAERGWLEELSILLPRISQVALDVTTQPDVRLAALLAYARIEPSSSGVATTLGDALNAVRDGRLADPDDRIGGSVLRLLYPESIAPSGIWAYASLLRRGAVVGEGWIFWRNVLCDETPVDELANLLDGFADDAERLWPILASAFAEELPWKLLARAVHEIGHQIEAARLYRWFAGVVANYARRARTTDETAELSAWLAANDQITLELCSIWIARSIDEQTRLDEKYFLGDVLVSTAPPNFVEWCARQAHARAATDWGLACTFVEAPIRYQHWIGEMRDAVIERLKSELTSSPSLLRHLDEYLAPVPAQKEFAERERRHQQEIDEIRAGHERERQQRQSDWRALLRESRDELATNCFSAPSLHTVALAYLGLLALPHDLQHPCDRVAELIGDSAELLDAAIGALRDAPLRDDLPTAERTAALAAESKHDWLAYPVLAGMDLREGTSQLDDSRFSEDRRRDVVAIYASHGRVAFESERRPTWPARWLRSNPHLVLDVCHRSALAAIKHGDTHLSMLDWLDEVEGLDDELRDFRLRLLKSISVRLPVAQLPVVDWLLHSIAEHPDRAALGKLVAQKLRAMSMTDGQRVRWLALDAIMHGADALEALDEFIDANEKRPSHLAAFLCVRFHGGSRFVDRLLGSEPIPTLRTLVSVIGRHFPPRAWSSGEVVSVGPAEKMSDLARRWIDELGRHPVEEAGAALDALIADERMSAWHESLKFVREQQHRLIRDASYSPMSVAEVLDLLRNGPPASVADLHAVLCDHLRDLGRDVRGNNADLWRQFWADDHKSPPERAKRENSCRDALLGMMRNRLPEGVDAQPEGQYAADRRADIRISFNNFNVPVEIKKNSHQDLWAAIEEQLIAQYTTDPGSGGYGIYLVLWFGSDIDGYRRHPIGGDLPETPDELECLLNDSLSHEQRRRISVIVLDVTKP